MTRTCKWPECDRRLITQRADAEFCSEICRSRYKNKERRKQAGTTTRVDGAEEAAGHPIAQIRADQEAAKSHWSGIVREAILHILRERREFHADDLANLGIPDEHKNIVGSQVARLVNQGWMVERGRRKSKLPSRNGAKSNVYQLTKAGVAGVGAEGGLNSPGPNGPLSVDPGDSRAGGHREPSLKPSGAAAKDDAAPGPASPVPLFEEEHRPLNPLRDREAA